MFVEKLNIKQEGVYLLEDVVTITEGKWEGALSHDNVDHESITIYTGPKLTGDRVENFYISTPSKTPWRTELKIFSDEPEVYIAYESTGDQVDADDINLLQDSVESTVSNLNEYKEANDASVGSLTDRATNLEDTRAKKTYVDTELNKVYSKEQVYTKEEVLNKVRELIGTAPEALDTLGKLADALDNDPNFATNIINLLAGKVDVIDGKSLSDENYSLIEKNKLAGIEAKANNYSHPATHSANIIVENTSKRFVTDAERAEIAKVKDKANAADVPTKNSQLTNDRNFITQSELGTAGYGDMSKSTYDKNNNGKVDIADNADRFGGKLPSQYMKVGPLTWNDLKGV